MESLYGSDKTLAEYLVSLKNFLKGPGNNKGR